MRLTTVSSLLSSHASLSKPSAESLSPLTKVPLEDLTSLMYIYLFSSPYTSKTYLSTFCPYLGMRPGENLGVKVGIALAWCSLVVGLPSYFDLVVSSTLLAARHTL
jgi:hypothetical protein